LQGRRRVQGRQAQQLRQQRLLLGLPLAQVASAICHDADMLKAIEEDRANHLAPIYKKGYIRAYAHYLKFPEADIAAMIQAEDNLLEQNEPRVQAVFSASARRKPADQWLRVTSYVLASMLIGTLAWQFSREAARLSQAGSASNPGLQDKPGTVEGRAAQRIDTGPVNASIAPLGVMHAGQFKTLDPAEQAWAAISQPVLAAGFSRLRVSVSADSWVEITDADGQELEMDLLRGGHEKTYQGRRPYQILLGRASAVRLFMDGKQVNITPFTRDDVARLSWPTPIRAENKQTGQD